jgi:hypothetical protein
MDDQSRIGEDPHAEDERSGSASDSVVVSAAVDRRASPLSRAKLDDADASSPAGTRFDARATKYGVMLRRL